MINQNQTNRSSELHYASSSIMAKRAENFALVTGASSGIGYAIAEEMARKKLPLVLVALPGTGLKGVAQTLARKYNIEVYSFSVDLTQPDGPFNLLKACESININILVNNAGFGIPPGLFADSDLSDLQGMMALNNHALVTLTYLFIPKLKKAGRAYIMNVGSLASLFNIPYKAVYSATKSFVYSFSAALRLELKPNNIFVSCLCPGVTLTSRIRDFQEQSGKKIPFTQMPEAVAQTAVKQLFRKQFKIVPGIYNQLMFGVSRFLPGFIIDKILSRKFKPLPLSAFKLALPE